jgi:diaminopimelate decarboxylase
LRGIKQISRSGLAKAISRVKTPFYYYDAQVLRSRLTALRSVLPRGWNVYYAAKANPNVALLEVYRELGVKAECASAGEMLACLKAGYNGGGISLSGPVKTDAEFRLIRKNRPFIIHAESKEELASLNRLGRRINVALRLNLDLRLSGRGGAQIMTGGDDKFGFSTDDAKNLLKERKRYGRLNFVGFHIYMGTQIRSAEKWIMGGRRFLESAAALSRELKFRPSYLNLGGGPGIAYRDGHSEFDLKKLEGGLKKLNRWAEGVDEFSDARFYMEPGRYLIGPAGVYVIKVLAVKSIRGKNYAMTDGGIHHALFPFRISREFPVKLLSRRGGGRKLRYILGGPLCTSLDQSDLPASLPRLKVGDILGIFQSGSYGFSTGMHFFLSHPMPAEVLGDGNIIQLIRKPSATAHLFDNQTKSELG